MDIETDLTSKQRFERAKDLSISALLADSIYNFGELVRILHFISLIELTSLRLDYAPCPRCP